MFRGGKLDYTVAFTANNRAYQILSILSGQEISAPVVNPTSDIGGYVFDKWVLNDEDITFPITPTSDLNFIASFKEIPKPGEDILNDTLTFEDGTAILSNALNFENHKSYLLTVDEGDPHETYSFIISMEGTQLYLLNGIKTYDSGDRAITSLAMYGNMEGMIALDLSSMYIESGEHHIKISPNPNNVRSYGAYFYGHGISAPTFNASVVLTGADIPTYTSVDFSVDSVSREIVSGSFEPFVAEQLPDVTRFDFEVVNSDQSFLDENSTISITLKGDGLDDLVLYENEPVNVLSISDTHCACDNMSAVVMMSFG